MKALKILWAASLVAAMSACTEEHLEEEPRYDVTITGISPLKGTVGDTITITGTNFGTKVENVKVYFATQDYVYTAPYEVSPTIMKVKVPDNAQTGFISVYVEDKYYAQYTDKQFQFLTFAKYFSLSTYEGRPGELITVSGDYAGAAPSSVRLQFQGMQDWLEPVEVEGARKALFRIPANAQSGTVMMKSDNEVPTPAQKDFTVLPAKPALQTGAWTERSALPGGSGEGGSRMGAFVFVLNNKAYMGGGTTLAPFDGFGSSVFWEYDPQYDAWRERAQLPVRRVYAQAFVINNKGYVGTGYDSEGEPTKDLYEYDPAANTWTKKADLPGVARSGAVAFAVGNEGFIGAGANAADEKLSDFYRYNPSSNTWTSCAAIPMGRTKAFAFAAGGKGYVGGGVNTTQTGQGKEFYEYDPVADKWTPKTWISASYGYLCLNAATSLNGKGYVGLGHPTTTTPVRYLGTNEVYEYSPATDTWKPMPVFGGEERSGGVAFAFGNAVYFGLGQAHAALYSYSDIWGYKF